MTIADGSGRHRVEDSRKAFHGCSDFFVRHWVARHQLMATAARNLHGEEGVSYAGSETFSFSAAVTTARLGEGRKTVKQVPYRHHSRQQHLTSSILH
jgi:hypothetical protein